MQYERRISNYNPVLANQVKQEKLLVPFGRFKLELQNFIDRHLRDKEIPALPGPDYTKPIDFPARLSQVVAKMGSSMIRSITEKIKKAESAGNTQKYQDEIIEAYRSSEFGIDINRVNIELDSRFIDIQVASDTKICDYWVIISKSYLQNEKLFVPLKLTNHMKGLIKRGYELKTNSLRLNCNGSFGLYFVKPKRKPVVPNNPRLLGIDIGRNKVITCSDGAKETTHSTGWNIKALLDILKRKKHKSKNSSHVRREIKNQINYSLKNDITWNNIDVLVIENLTDMKRGNKWGNKSQNWRVGYILNKITQLCEENNVWLTRINPAHTSQTCSACGHVDKKSRFGENFSCTGCDFVIDADINAAINIRNKGANSPLIKKHLVIDNQL